MKLISGLIFLSGVVATVISTTCRLVSFSGGGSHGAFESGVLNKMVHEKDFGNWDVHLGVSAGSLTVLSLLRDDYKNNLDYVRDIWWNTKTLDVLSPLSSDTSLSGNDKVFELINKTFHSLVGSPSRGVFRAGVTDLETGNFLALPLSSDTPDLKRILASTSIPIVFPPVFIESLGITAVDGGLQCNEMIFGGLQFCPEGTTNYEMDLVFAYFEENNYTPKSWNLFTVGYRTVDIITHEFNNLLFKTLGNCEKKSSNFKITIIMPDPNSPSSGISALDFDHGEQLWKEGYYNTTKKVIYC